MAKIKYFGKSITIQNYTQEKLRSDYIPYMHYDASYLPFSLEYFVIPYLINNIKTKICNTLVLPVFSYAREICSLGQKQV
jgi:hypothetical protein